MDRWACESPLHEGDRMGVHPVDQFTRRETFYRRDGGERMEEKSKDRICRVCIRREKLDANQSSLLDSVPGEA
jgi:hypothetical protein